MKGNFTYRLLYEKNVNARYISHLDFVRVLNRAIRRSGLSVTYTIGFNPHPVMTVAAPIPVGTTSEYECMEMDFDEDYGAEVIKSRFNEIMPSGIKILDAKKKTDSDVLFRDIDESEYKVFVQLEKGSAIDTEKFLSLDDITIDKRSKSGVKQVNIRGDIKKLELIESDGESAVFLLSVPCGNTYNLKPELVFTAMEKYMPDFKCECVLPHRICIYAKNKKIF